MYSSLSVSLSLYTVYICTCICIYVNISDMIKKSPGLGPGRVRSRNVYVCCLLSNVYISSISLRHVLRLFNGFYNFCYMFCLLFG